MKILVYCKYYNFQNLLDKPKIETFVVELPQIPRIGETIVMKRISSKQKGVIVFEYIVTAVQFNTSQEDKYLPHVRVNAFLNQCCAVKARIPVTNFSNN